MKISIPCLGNKGFEEKVSAHFGRAPAFFIYDTESEEHKTIANTSEHMGGSGKPPEIMDEENVDIMLTSNLGRRAVNLFESMGIEVYCGAEGTVEDAIESWRNDKLTRANEDVACEHGH